MAIALLAPGGAAKARCRVDPPIAPVLLQQYLATPAALLYGGPQAAEELRVAVRRFAPTGPDAIKAVLSTVADASHGQQVAIGRGLAEAAGLCTTQDSAIVQRIKNAVRASGSSVVEQSFMTVFEDSAGDDAAAMPSKSVETHRLTTGSARPAMQSLLPDDPTKARKLPDPFGAPDEWR